jgi:hypothetical protein
LEPLRGSSNKKTLYSTRSCVNWAFFGTRGPLKRSFHSRFKMAHACQKRPNLHTNSSNKLLLHGRYFKELEQPEINIQASHAWLKKSNIHPETEGFIFAIQDRVINTRNYKKHICGLQSIIDKCRICGTEGETIEHIISSCTVLAQSEYKKRHDIFAKIIHINLAVKFNLLKNTQPHYSYTPESCLENDSYKLYFDRTINFN